MEKFPLIAISTAAVLTSLVTANEEISCQQIHGGAFNICKHSAKTTLFNQPMVYPAFKLDLKGFSTIVPSDFENLRNPSFTFIHLNSENCTPKTVELTPQSFNDWSSVDILDLKCVKFTVKPKLFKNFQSVTLLCLRTVEFNGVPQEFFADFPHLDELHLYDLNLKTISAYMFSTINQKLRKLLIYDEKSLVEPQCFKRFFNLDHLLLRLSQLSEIRSDMFDGLNRLRFLGLSGSKIALLRGNIFRKLSNLKTLYLTHNRISQIEPQAFSGLNNLLELFLNDNKLESLATGVFRNLKNLKELALGNNKLKSISAEVFHNLQNLETLAFEYNEIETVPSHAFNGCINLSMLSLDHNKINHIEPNVFRGLNLDELNLNHNDLNVLEPDTFSGLYIEYLLDLSHNNITVIKPQAFRNMKTVGENYDMKIVLSSHNITDVDRKNWAVDDSIKKIDIIAYKG